MWLTIKFYSDASFAGNAYLSSRLCSMIFFAHNKNICQPISWSSHKAKSVTRSVLGRELTVFAVTFHLAYTIRTDMNHMFSMRTPLNMYMDNLSLFLSWQKQPFLQEIV